MKRILAILLALLLGICAHAENLPLGDALAPSLLAGSWEQVSEEVEGSVFPLDASEQSGGLEISLSAGGQLTADYFSQTGDRRFELNDAPLILLDSIESHLDACSAASWEAKINTQGQKKQFADNYYEDYYLTLMDADTLVLNFMAECSSEPYRVSSIHLFTRVGAAPDPMAMLGSWELSTIEEEGMLLTRDEISLEASLEIYGDGYLQAGGSYTAELTWRSEDENIEMLPLEMRYHPRPLYSACANPRWSAVLDAAQALPGHSSSYALTLTDPETMEMMVLTSYPATPESGGMASMGMAKLTLVRPSDLSFEEESSYIGLAAYDLFPELESDVANAPYGSILLGLNNYTIGQAGLEGIEQVTIGGDGEIYCLAAAGCVDNTGFEIWQGEDMLLSAVLQAGEVMLIGLPDVESTPYWEICYNATGEEWWFWTLTPEASALEGWWYIGG